MNAFTKIKRLSKNSLIISVMLFAAMAPSFVWPASSVSAAPCSASGKFLTLPRWHDGVSRTVDDNCVVEIENLSDIWIIALNAIDIVLQIVGYIAAGFVIYGAIRYVISSGNPDNVGKAKDTIVKALIGMVIAMSAAAVVGFIAGNIG
jgi:hypothetical protein